MIGLPPGAHQTLTKSSTGAEPFLTNYPSTAWSGWRRGLLVTNNGAARARNKKRRRSALFYIRSNRLSSSDDDRLDLANQLFLDPCGLA